MGEGREGTSRTGRDPWVFTALGVDGKSFSILPGIKKDNNLSCNYIHCSKIIKVIPNSES